jgi:hypothetical protein
MENKALGYAGGKAKEKDLRLEGRQKKKGEECKENEIQMRVIRSFLKKYKISKYRFTPN